MMNQEAVRKGAALLDERKPGWRKLVDPDNLHMLNHCILDQVYGDYFVGLRELFGTTDPQESAGHGFGCEGEGIWLKVIAEGEPE
jgi:hypothetical protein